MEDHMTRMTIGTALLLGSLALGAAAFAGDYGSSSSGDWKSDKMDTNKDGNVSADEYAAGARSMFSSMDTNSDGKVTAAEMDAYRAMKKDSSEGRQVSSADRIKQIDTNGDGIMSADEHAANARSMFSRMDTNQDGQLTAAELKAGHKRMVSDASSVKSRSTSPTGSTTTTTQTPTTTTTQTPTQPDTTSTTETR
jgi:hypothetical protein